MEVLCSYCKNPAKKVTGREIYPELKQLHHKEYYQCVPCDAYVGCHSNSGKPYGTLAKKGLRLKRMKTHEIFDSVWKSGHMSRTEAYSKLALWLKISYKDCHIGQFNLEQCNKVQEIVKQWFNPKVVIPDDRQERYKLAFRRHATKHEWEPDPEAYGPQFGGGPTYSMDFEGFVKAVEDLVRWKAERARGEKNVANIKARHTKVIR